MIFSIVSLSGEVTDGKEIEHGTIEYFKEKLKIATHPTEINTYKNTIKILENNKSIQEKAKLNIDKKLKKHYEEMEKFKMEH